VEDTVCPLAVPQVGAAADTFAKEARPLGVALGPLVEAVDLELEAVEAELEQEVALEDPRGVVGEAAAAEVGMNREVAEICDPRAAVRELEAHQPGAPPLSVVLDLDHEAAELTGPL